MVGPRRSIGLDDSVDGRAALEALRRQLQVEDEFSAEVASAARAAVARGPQPVAGASDQRIDRRDVDFATLDPPGSRDLDQAFAIVRRGGGYRLLYAIADVAAFVVAGDPVDVETRKRGSTMYLPDGRVPLHPGVLSEGGASLLPGEERPAVLWQLDLDGDGALVDTWVGRALVRSRRALAYPDAQRSVELGDDELLTLLCEVGERRLAAEAARGGVSLALAEQEVRRSGDGRYQLLYRASLPVERWNAQLSLLTGMAAANLMLQSGQGLLRTLPAPRRDVVAGLQRAAGTLGVAGPKNGNYAACVRAFDPTTPIGAALLNQAARALRGAGYATVTAAMSAENAPIHAAVAAPYAHVTAPLRRLADRFATEAALAGFQGRQAPEWALSALATMPEVMAATSHRAASVENAVIDLMEALVLSDRIGETFDAVVIDIEERRRGAAATPGGDAPVDPTGVELLAKVQLHEPAVIARVPARGWHLGDLVKVRVVSADVMARQTRFQAALG